MSERIKHSLSQLRTSFLQIWGFDTLSIIVALLIFCSILLNLFPTVFHMLGFKARAGFTGFIPFFVVLLYTSFRIPGRLGKALSITLTFSFFGLSLAGLWQTGQSQSTVFNGIVPLFDASDYYIDALRLMAGQPFSPFSARRPLFPGLLAVLLTITGSNLMAALGILTAITACACYLAAKEIQRTHGAEAAVFILTILFLFYRYNNGLTMSESLGVALGALGFVFLWRGIADSKQPSFWIGLFVTTLALNARAGAFFVLPLLLLWGTWIFRAPETRPSWRFLLGGLGAIAGGFLVNWLVFRLLAVSSGTLFANFSYSLYGLASGGKHWSYIFTVHPELANLPEPYQSSTIYRLAFKQIMQNPGLLLQGMLYNWSNFFSTSAYGAFSYVSGGNVIVNTIIQHVLLVLCAIGIYKALNKKSSDAYSSFVTVAALGVLISVPFLPPTDASRMRPYAASMIIFALLPAMGLVFILEKLNSRIRLFLVPDQASPDYEMATVLSLGLILIMTFGSYFVKLVGNPPALPSPNCGAGFVSIVTRFDAGTYFNVVSDDDPVPDGIPNFHLNIYKSNSHELADPNLINWAIKAKPPVTMFYALDYRTYGKALISIPNKLLPQPGTLLEICGKWEIDPNLAGYKILYAKSTNALSP